MENSDRAYAASETGARCTLPIARSNRRHLGQLLAFEPGADIAGGHGFGEQVALGPGAAEVLQGGEFGGGFHGFYCGK